MGPFRLLGRITSINVRKVAWTADVIGLDYVREDWGKPYRDPHEPEFLALNPNAQVPVIVRDGFVLWESNAIMRHLAETSRSALLPAPPRDRALVDQWLTWQATELNPRWNYAVQALLRRNPECGDAARVADSLRQWTAAMRLLETQLASGSGFVTGDHPTLADIAIALSTHRWFMTPFDRPELPAVTAHYDTLRIGTGIRYLTPATP